MGIRQIKREEIKIEEVKNIIHGLYLILNKPQYKFGIAGSFARGEQKSRSDVDIVISGVEQLSLEEYIEITNYLDNRLSRKYDILVLDGMMKDDEMYDSILEDIGLPENEDSAYKNVKREVKWIE